jgi:hypothetical protein
MKTDVDVIFRNLKVVNFPTLSEALVEISKLYNCDIRDLYYSNQGKITIKGTKVWIAGKNLKTPAALIFG